MGDGNAFEFEGGASPAEAADTLTRIAEGMRARALSLSMGDEEITVYHDEPEEPDMGKDTFGPSCSAAWA